MAQLCCDALFGETVKVKLDHFILLLKKLQLAKIVYSLINVGIRTVLIMELPVAITGFNTKQWSFSTTEQSQG